MSNPEKQFEIAQRDHLIGLTAEAVIECLLYLSRGTHIQSVVGETPLL